MAGKAEDKGRAAGKAAGKAVGKTGTVDKAALGRVARGFGASVVRVADTARLAGIETEPVDLLAEFPRAVSLAVRLSDGIMDAIEDRPTPLYSSHYSRVNAVLDDVAVRTANWLAARGARALPIPASQILDDQRWTSYISHKAVAVAAGIGWQGKSLLVVSPDFGPRIRLVTVLTDAALAPDEPLKNRCGTCTKCRDACPAGAIRGVNTASHYESREEALDFQKCVVQVRDKFAELPYVAGLICGVCIAVCPWGRRAGRGVRKAG